MTAVKAARRRRVATLMRKRGWNRGQLHGSIRNRILDLVDCHHPWYDWGHRLMIIVGQNTSGSWDEPRPPTWWYRLGSPTKMFRTGYPRHPLRTFQIIKSYDEFRKRTEGLNEDQLYEWQAIGVNQDGDLHLGHQYWGGTFYGLSHWDVALLRRYLRAWRRLDWFGLRSWLYTQGLRAAVDLKKPFACNATPPRGQGGYQHWHCRLKRRHGGLHRFNAYVWGEVGGEPIGTVHQPEGVKR